MAARVHAKLEDGDFKGAVRLVSSEDTIAKPNSGSLSALQEKHPSFINLVLRGEAAPFVRPSLFGATLIALNKKGGRVRPIAVGCMLRRLAAKCAGNHVMQAMGALLALHQLGYGVPLGVEAAVHATRIFLQNLQPGHLILKLDFRNAFNCLHRDKMIKAVGKLMPELLPLVLSAYGSPSFLFYGENIILSSEGVQQGDPLGPLLFCLTIHNMAQQLCSGLNVFYLDDSTLGGILDDVLQDLSTVQREARELSIQLNCKKSEMICEDTTTRKVILRAVQGVCEVDRDQATMLTSLISNNISIRSAIQAKSKALELLGNKLQYLYSHDAFCLLRHTLAIPKALHMLRTSLASFPCTAQNFDSLLRSLLGTILNINLTDLAWTQASLPVWTGSLGVKSTTLLAPSTFLASAAGSAHLVHQILPQRFHNSPCPATEEVLNSWHQGNNVPPPSGLDAFRQKAWDLPRVTNAAKALLMAAPDETAHAHLLAFQRKETGEWLQAPPKSALGLRMEDEVIRVAAGLRLGATLCHPHQCHQCGADVDQLALHGLESQGRHPRYAAMNELVRRSLASAKIPSHLEPSGIMRSDEKRPDGATVMPWKSGQTLAWDVTCPDTFAPSHMALAAREAGTVASKAESNKLQKYALLGNSYHFVPIAIEASGVFGPKALSFRGSWEDGSRLRLGNHVCCSSCSRESRWRCSGATQQQCWALHPPQTLFTFNYGADTAVP